MPSKKTVSKTAIKLLVKGIVQGVGFRPFIYRLARQQNLSGLVKNVGHGVEIHLEGSLEDINHFLQDLCEKLPPLAVIDDIKKNSTKLKGYKDFIIKSSQKNTSEIQSFLPPDIATCALCFKEISNKDELRYKYPFTNCTSCGPRFTIARNLPYDRSTTSMAKFTMCSLCKSEYENVEDRRFHAQPIACPECGPTVTMKNKKGEPLTGDWYEVVQTALKKGEIIALKGLGGFHLVCDGKNSKPVQLLRERKNRPQKPFAVMVDSIETARKFCYINKKGEDLLSMPSSPIVMFDKKVSNLPQELAPGLNTLGVMLPYTPLHYLLFTGGLDLLVMTSGNRGGLPLIIDNKQAFNELADFVDVFLFHEREIVNRCDDSVISIFASEKTNFSIPFIMVRRSRGFVPEGVKVPVPGNLQSLGSGSEMKNTFCLLKNETAYVSQHMGEMEFVESVEAYMSSLNSWQEFIDAKPKILGYDSHPGYNLTAKVLDLPCWDYTTPVQHHHAHMAAVMAEHGIKEKVLGVILDGNGYGEDGNIWGFEILAGDYLSFDRLYHMKYFPLPGGKKAVEEPWRTAVAILSQAGGVNYAKEKAMNLLKIEEKQIDLVLKMIERSLNSPLASSGGRLFDAASALLAICQKNTYEGEGAIKLSEAVFKADNHMFIEKLDISYSFSLEGQEISFEETILELVKDIQRGTAKEIIAVKFHLTLIKAIKKIAMLAREKTGIETIVLSGGVFQNRFLANKCMEELSREGFIVKMPIKFPVNDGGLSLGQAVIAAWRRWYDVSSGSSRSFRN